MCAKYLGVRADKKRNFELVCGREETGEVYVGATPRQAAEEASRFCIGDDGTAEIAMKEIEGDVGQVSEEYRPRVHVYEARRTDDSIEVSKTAITSIDEYLDGF